MPIIDPHPLDRVRCCRPCELCGLKASGSEARPEFQRELRAFSGRSVFCSPAKSWEPPSFLVGCAARGGESPKKKVREGHRWRRASEAFALKPGHRILMGSWLNLQAKWEQKGLPTGPLDERVPVHGPPATGPHSHGHVAGQLEKQTRKHKLEKKKEAPNPGPSSVSSSSPPLELVGFLLRRLDPKTIRGSGHDPFGHLPLHELVPPNWSTRLIHSVDPLGYGSQACS